MSKYEVIFGLYFPVFALNSPNTGKYGQEITPYLDTFHALKICRFQEDQDKVNEYNHDTRIALLASQETDDVVVVSKDTDVLGVFC